MKISYDKIQDLVDAAAAKSLQIRRDLHQNPELSEHEVHTSARVRAELKQLGIPYRSEIAGHGIKAVLTTKSKEPAVAIRADMDALPIQEKVDLPFKSQNDGVMHACGHDIHTAVLLGTASVLKALQEELPRTTVFLFEPAEETRGGAKPMIEEGCLEDPRVDTVIGLQAGVHARLHECGFHDVYGHRQRQILSWRQSLHRH